MWKQWRTRLASLEGRRVHLSLKDGTRIDDCQLISAGSRRAQSLWIFTNGDDAFVPMDHVLDVWESACL